MIHSMGTISLALNSNVIQGSNTYFQTVGKTTTGTLLIIELPQIGSQLLQVVAVVSDTELRVSKVDGTPYLSPVALQNIKYGLCKNFTHTTTAEIAKQLAELTAKWQRRETEMTGWYVSDDDTYPVTGFLGEQKQVPTPAFINRLTQVASTASSDLSQMAMAIEQNKQTLATVEPRLVAFESKFTQAQAHNNNVNTKHNDVVLKHSQVSDAFNAVQNMAAAVEAQHGETQGAWQAIEAQAQQIELDVEHADAHSKLSVEAAAIAEQKASEATNVLTQTQQLSNTLTQSVSDATVTITQAKASAVQSIEQQVDELTQQVLSAKQSIDDRAREVSTQAAQFTQTIKTSEYKANSAAATAIIKANLSTLKADSASIDAEKSQESVGQVEMLVQQVHQANVGITKARQAAEFSALHCTAYSALSQLTLETQVANTANIKTAFSAVLAGTLTQSDIDKIQ